MDNSAQKMKTKLLRFFCGIDFQRILNLDQRFWGFGVKGPIAKLHFKGCKGSRSQVTQNPSIQSNFNLIEHCLGFNWKSSAFLRASVQGWRSYAFPFHQKFQQKPHRKPNETEYDESSIQMKKTRCAKKAFGGKTVNFMFYTPTQRRSRVDSLGADVLNERGINKTEISLHFGRFRTCVRKSRRNT